MHSWRPFRGRPLPTSIPIPGALATTPNAPRRTTAAAPSTPLCFATGSGGGSGSRSAIRLATRWRDLEHAATIATSAAQPARQANACHAGCFRSSQFERPTASRPRMPATKPTPVEPRTPPEPLRSGAFTMQQSRQPPLNPAAGTPAATIGMRPATSLRKRQSQLMDSFGLSGVVGYPTRPALPASLPP